MIDRLSYKPPSSCGSDLYASIWSVLISAIGCDTYSTYPVEHSVVSRLFIVHAIRLITWGNQECAYLYRAIIVMEESTPDTKRPFSCAAKGMTPFAQGTIPAV